MKEVKKIILSIVLILILNVLGVAAITDEKIQTDSYPMGNRQNNIQLGDDELDQYQNESSSNVAGIIGYHEGVNVSGAQSFIPTKGILTRVQLYISKGPAASYPYVLAIRSNLTGGNIVTTSVSPDEISEYPSLEWIEFDFDNIRLTPGQTYYIVSYTANITQNTYQWGTFGGYPNGTKFGSTDDGKTWTPGGYGGDFCFKTYGISTTELELNISIKPGISSTLFVKNIGDIEAYNVEWNLNITGGIFGFINTHLNDTIDILAPDNEIVVPFPSLFGLGPLTISATTKASNADTVLYTGNGFILLFFIFLW